MGEDKRLILQTWFHILGELFNPISVVLYSRTIIFHKNINSCALQPLVQCPSLTMVMNEADAYIHALLFAAYSFALILACLIMFTNRMVPNIIG
jgi:hypothetical protein